MNACGERERERERGRLRGRGGESKEPVAMFLGVNRAMTQSAESRDEPATRIVLLEVSDLVPTDRHYSRVRCVAAHGPRSRAADRGVATFLVNELTRVEGIIVGDR